MIRTFNYTGRKGIERRRLSVSINRDTNGGARFDAGIQVQGLGLPEDARVYVEAFRKTMYMRFDFGTVRAIQPPADRQLREFGGSQVFFRLKVVDESQAHGLLLAEADRVAPRNPELSTGDRICLLEVDVKDLGQEIWRLDLDDAMPVLELNHRIPGVKDIALSSSVFFGLVYPSVVRQILTRILIIEQWPLSDDGSDWRNLWLEYMRGFHREKIPSMKVDPASVSSWIDDAVQAYCKQMSASDRYGAALQVEQTT